MCEVYQLSWQTSFSPLICFLALKVYFLKCRRFAKEIATKVRRPHRSVVGAVEVARLVGGEVPSVAVAAILAVTQPEGHVVFHRHLVGAMVSSATRLHPPQRQIQLRLCPCPRTRLPDIPEVATPLLQIGHRWAVRSQRLPRKSLA